MIRKYWKAPLFGLALAGTVVVAVAGCSSSLSTYENPEYGIKIDYPLDWKQTETKDTIVAFLPGAPGVSLNLTMNDLSGQSMTPQKNTDASLRQLKQTFPDMAIIEQGPVTLAGEAAYKVVYDTSELRVMQQWTIKNDLSYVWTFVSPKIKYADYSAVTQKTLDSFKITRNPRTSNSEQQATAQKPGGPSAPPGASATQRPQAAPAPPQSGTTLRRAQTIAQPGQVRSLVSLRDGSFITAFMRNNTYQKYDGKSGRSLGEFTPTVKGGAAPVTNNSGLAVTPSEKHMLVVDPWNNHVLVIDLAARTYVGTVRLSTPGHFIKVTDDTAWVLTSQGAVAVDITQAKTGETLQAADADDIALSADGRTAYILRVPASSDARPKDPKLVKLDRGSKQEQAMDVGPYRGVGGGTLLLSPDGQRLYVVLNRARLMALDAASGKVLKAVGLPISPLLGPMTLSPDGSLLALWATATGTVSTSPAPNPGYFVTEYIFVGGQVTLLETGGMKAVKADVADLEGPQSVAFSPDGKYLYVADKFKGVAVFER